MITTIPTTVVISMSQNKIGILNILIRILIYKMHREPNKQRKISKRIELVCRAVQQKRGGNTALAVAKEFDEADKKLARMQKSRVNLLSEAKEEGKCVDGGMREGENAGMGGWGNAGMREWGNAGSGECGNGGMRECRNGGDGGMREYRLINFSGNF